MTDYIKSSAQEVHAKTASGHYETFYVDSFLADLRWYSMRELYDFIARVGLFYDISYEEARSVAVKIISYMLHEKLIRTMSYVDPYGRRPVEDIILYIEEATEGVHSTKEMMETHTVLWFMISSSALLRGAAKRSSLLGSQKYDIKPETKPAKIIKDEMKHLRSLLTEEYIAGSDQYLEEFDFEWIIKMRARKLIS